MNTSVKLFDFRNISLIATLILCFLSVHYVNGQSHRGNYNYKEFQAKPYYFGITLGYNSSAFDITPSDHFIDNEYIAEVQSVSGPGFNLGIVSNLKIGKYFDFRFLPTLSFAEKNITYTSVNNERPNYSRKVESVFVELPFQARYKSAPFNDIRLFMIAGLKYSYDVNGSRNFRQADEFVKISPTNFAVEYGAGVQFFFPYFIFSPEIKVSHGLGNTLIYNGNLEESNVIEKVLSRALTISLHFEG
ncbi:MAG: porin family protein [Saprospiraceae bacterium]